MLPVDRICAAMSESAGHRELDVEIEADDVGGARHRQVGDEQPFVRREHDQLTELEKKGTKRAQFLIVRA